VTRTLCLAGLLLSALALSVPAQDVEPKRNVKLHKTPKDCFEALMAASEKRDARAMVDCFTPEAIKQMAGDVAGQSFFFRDQAEGKLFKDKDVAKPDEATLKRLKPVLEVLDKHGLTEKATKDLKPKGFRPTKKEREALLKLIKKPEQFVVDFMNAQEKGSTRPARKDAPKPTLADLKIDGDKATANLVIYLQLPSADKDKAEKREIKQPITFQKIDGGWRVNPQPDRKEDEPKLKDNVKDGFKDKKEK
jgi:hypothetical protein